MISTQGPYQLGSESKAWSPAGHSDARPLSHRINVGGEGVNDDATGGCVVLQHQQKIAQDGAEHPVVHLCASEKRKLM